MRVDLSSLWIPCCSLFTLERHPHKTPDLLDFSWVGQGQSAQIF
jgi:hypothetical protein